MPDVASLEFRPVLLDEVVESLAEGVVLLDTEGRIFYVNRAVIEKLGVPAELLIGRRFDDSLFTFTTSDGRPLPPEERPFLTVMKSGRPLTGFDYKVSIPGRTPLSVLLNAVPLRFDGELVGVAMSMTDVTERMRAEEALRESEERFRAILDQSRYGIVIAAPDGEVLVHNKAMEEITGNPTEEVKARGFLEVAYPDEERRRQVAQQAERQVRGEIPYVEELYHRRDGRDVWLSYAFTPVHLRDKEYLLGITTDITERKEAEAKVRFQSRLLDEVRNAVIASDMSGHITYMNHEAERLFESALERARGRNVMEMLHPRALDNEREVMTATRETGRWEGEATFTHPDGRQTPILLSLGLLTDDGKPEGYVGVAVDITDIREAQRALEEKDKAIRLAYVDVISAITGGKLVLMTEEELHDALGEPATESGELRPDNLSESRHEVLAKMTEAGTAMDPTAAIVAYGEAATNALKHAGGGWYRLYRRDGVLQVDVVDHGHGIDFRTLPKATLTAGFSSKQTLGMGFSIMLDLADRVLLATGPGCTEVVLEFGLA